METEENVGSNNSVIEDTPTDHLLPVHESKYPAMNPMQMLSVAINQNCAIEKMEKLMALEERWRSAQAKNAYTEAMASFKASPPTLKKDKKASFVNTKNQLVEYSYLGLAECAVKIAEALSAHGLSHNWKVKQDQGSITVTCRLTHKDGHYEEVSLTSVADTSGSKNAIQQIASTISYLERYTLLAITGLAAQDQDDDGAAANPQIIDLITDEQAMDIVSAAKEKGIEIEKIKRRWKIEDLRQLRSSDFDIVIQQINNTKGGK